MACMSVLLYVSFQWIEVDFPELIYRFGGRGSYVVMNLEWVSDERGSVLMKIEGTTGFHLNSKIYDSGYRVQSLSGKWTFKDIRSADGYCLLQNDRNKCLFYDTARALEFVNRLGRPAHFVLG